MKNQAHTFHQGQKVQVRDWYFQAWVDATYVAYFQDVTMPHMVDITHANGIVRRSIYNECQAL